MRPEGWVTEKRYNKQKLDRTLEHFIAEREKSVTWLASLETPDWTSSISLPWGTLSAGDILAAWLAHDLSHLRQLVALRYQLTKLANHPYRVDYAGNW